MFAVTSPRRPAPEARRRTVAGDRAVVFTIGTQDNPGNFEDAIIAGLDLFTTSAPRELFRLGFDRRPGPARDYDVSPDGRRFITSRRPPDDPVLRHINLITSFAATPLGN